MVHGKKTRYYLYRPFKSQTGSPRRTRPTPGFLIIVSSPRVAIFRKRLLSYSETFIADQGRLLPRYRAVFCGFAQDASGFAMIADTEPVLLESHSVSPGLAKLLFRHGLGGGRAWVEALARHAPALVHAHFFSDGIDALRLGRLLDVPVATTVHGHDITKHANAGAQARARRRFFDGVDRVIAVSRYMADRALERGCPEHKLVQHYIGIDLDKFTRARNESAEPTLLFVGRLVEKKGCTYLLQAMESLHAKYPDLHLTIVGDGELRPALEREAAERRLRVEFAGSESPAKIRDRLASAWLFAAPSVTAIDGDTEGLGMVFLEAQALQTPVVSFRSGGVVEAVADGETALLCDERDVDALADNIDQLLENPALRHQMGSRGRARVESQFDIRKQCALLEQIYDGIR